jgi:hypothetical protein
MFLKIQNKTAAVLAVIVVVVIVVLVVVVVVAVAVVLETVVVVVVVTNGRVNESCSGICYLCSHFKTRYMIKPFIKDHW